MNMNIVFIIYSILAILSLIGLILIRLSSRSDNILGAIYDDHTILFDGISYGLFINFLGMGLCSILYWTVILV